MNGFVYILMNTENGKAYVGQTTGKVRNRLAAHFRSARQGGGFLLHKAIRKHGKKCFEVFGEVGCDSKAALDAIEKYFIIKLKSRNPDFGYNLTEGGEGGKPFAGHQHTESAKRKIRRAQRGKKKPKGFGKKVSRGLKGKAKSAGHRKNLSGKNNGMFGRTGSKNPMYGKQRPDLAAYNRRRRNGFQ